MNAFRTVEGGTPGGRAAPTGVGLINRNLAIQDKYNVAIDGPAKKPYTTAAGVVTGANIEYQKGAEDFNFATNLNRLRKKKLGQPDPLA